MDAVGITVAAQCGTGPIFVGGFGHSDLATATPAGPATVYEIGSVTKQFVAAEIMQLEAAGHLSVTDPISLYVDGLPATWRDVTIEQLLTHTGGVPDHFAIFNADPSTPMDWASDHTAAELVAEFVAIEDELTAAPGTTFIYSSTGYAMLTAAIERITGRSFAAAMEEAFFAPLALTGTTFCASDIDALATGYNIGPNGPIEGTQIPAWFLSGAAGICSSAGDLVRWERDLVSGSVVDSETFNLMATPTRLEDGSETDYGYGLHLGELGGEPAIYHEGGTVSFSSWLVYYPDRDLILAVLTNTLGPNPLAIRDFVVELAAAFPAPPSP